MATEPSQSRLPAELRGTLATARTDPNRWWVDGQLRSEDQVLATRGAGKGLWLYDELARDGMVGAALDRRKMAIVGAEYSLEAADSSREAAETLAFVKRTLARIGFNRVVRNLLDATLKGVAIAEILWEGTADGVLPRRIAARDPRRFTFREVADGEVELRLLTREALADGIAVPARKFIVHRFGEKNDNPWGLGLGQSLFWPVFFKRQGIGFWLGAVEKFGMPTVLGRYPTGTSEADQTKLLKALAAVSHDAAVIVPEGMVVELLEAKRAGEFDTYEKLARYMDDEIAKVVLGGTLTIGAGPVGGQALGRVHQQVYRELVKADADELSDTLNTTLIRWIIDINYPGWPAPRIWWDVKGSGGVDLNAQADIDTKLYEMGFQRTHESMRKIYGEGIIPRRT